jgi:hypothetical protein
MFKIIVDNIEKGLCSDNCGAVTVGSAADAHVRLPRAAAQSLTIYPMHGGDYGDFRVTVHDPEGATHHTTERWGRRNAVTVRHGPSRLWIRVCGGESLTVRGHVIQLISWCGRCDKAHVDCTCGNPMP